MDDYSTYAKAQAKDAKVTIRLPSAVVNGLKKEAARRKTRYQTLMGKILADHLARAKAAWKHRRRMPKGRSAPRTTG